MPSRRSLSVAEKRAEFEAVAIPFTDALYRTALRLMGGADGAGDLVQETYLRAYRTFENFEPGTNCRGWLLTILYSVFHNEYHKTRRQPALLPLDELEDRLQTYLESPDDAQYVAETRAVAGTVGARMDPEVTEALGRLPDEFREAVVLVDVEALSYDEAAAVLKCPVGTVRSRLYRGRRLLFVALRAYAAERGFARGVE